MTRRVLVLGAAGFLGRALAQSLASDRTLEVFVAHRGLGDRPDRLHLDDASNPDAVARVVAACRPDVLVNAVGRRNGAAETLFRDNLRTVDAIVSACTAHAPGALILQLGSAAEYGRPSVLPVPEEAPCRPISAYGEAKLAATVSLRGAAAAGMVRATILRLFNVVGPGMGPDTAPGAFLARLAAAGPSRPAVIRTGRLDAVRDFIGLDDVLGAVRLALAAPGDGEIVNICSGRGLSVGAVLRRMAALAGIAVRFETDDALGRHGDANRVVGATGKARTLLGFVATGDLDPQLAAAVRHALGPLPAEAAP